MEEMINAIDQKVDSMLEIAALLELAFSEEVRGLKRSSIAFQDEGCKMKIEAKTESMREQQDIKALVLKPKPVAPSYEETVSEVLRVAKTIPVVRTGGDGRIESAVMEVPFLSELKRQLLMEHLTWKITIPDARSSKDIIVNDVRINLKITKGSADNSVSKPEIYYSITGDDTYPTSSNWNHFWKRLQVAKGNNQIKTTRIKQSEYHYLVKNKMTGATLLKAIFDVKNIQSNADNDFQINWKKEFKHNAETADDTLYMKRVERVITTIHKSINMKIERTKIFAEADPCAFFC